MTVILQSPSNYEVEMIVILSATGYELAANAIRQYQYLVMTLQ